MLRTPNRQLTYKERIKVHLLAELGWKQGAIAQYLGISQQNVSNCLRTSCTPTKPKGRPPKRDTPCTPTKPKRRPPKRDTPMRKLLVRHPTENAEPRQKTREEIVQELGIEVFRRTLIKAFEEELYHRDKATHDFEAWGISKGWWPANSLDLNPIENMWQMLKYRLSRRFPKTNAEAKQYLKEGWEKVGAKDYTKYSVHSLYGGWLLRSDPGTWWPHKTPKKS
jgi:hypothetical protein